MNGWIRNIVIIIGLSGLYGHLLAATQPPPLAVVASPQLSFGPLDQREALNIFLLRKSVDKKGQPFLVYGIAPDQQMMFTLFVQRCLHWNPAILARKWERALYTGEGRAPYLAENWQQMRDLLTKKGAPGIGVLPLPQVPPSLKVLYTCKNDTSK